MVNGLAARFLPVKLTVPRMRQWCNRQTRVGCPLGQSLEQEQPLRTCDGIPVLKVSCQ